MAATASGKGRKKQRRVNPALMKPVEPDEDLAAVIGHGPVSRPQMVKRVWDYVKTADLQDHKNRRMINTDATLRKVMGGRAQVSMFELTKLVSTHVH